MTLPSAPSRRSADPDGPAARWASLGRSGPLARGSVAEALRAVTADPDPRVRTAALGALVRRAGRRSTRTAWGHAATDPEPAVRRHAAELAPALARPPARTLARLLDDPDPLVVETAAWALGEVPGAAGPAVGHLADLATTHSDPLVREAAVAALGAIGDPRGLPAILVGTRDKPAVRRRAVLALAPFSGGEVDEALTRAASDRDWQTRDAAATLGVHAPEAR